MTTSTDHNTASTPAPSRGWRAQFDVPVLMAFGCIIVLLVVGAAFEPRFLSPEYLLQLLKVGAVLGVIATGMMFVILIGQIDLSVPYAITMGGTFAAYSAGYGVGGEILAIPVGVLSGVVLGLVNGFIVAYLRVPSMIITLAVNSVAQGILIAISGGFAPQDTASPAMRYLATGTQIPYVPNAVVVWAITGSIALFILGRTTFGRAMYGIGNKESAAYLSGVPTQRVIMGAFALCGGLAAFGGTLLTGYTGMAAPAMGDTYLLPAIAAVVLGGTSILGGRGNYLGTVAGTILITLLTSILTVMQISDFARQIIFGVVIVGMLLLYGRAPKTRG